MGSLEEAIRRAMGGRREIRKPVCLMKEHIDLQRSYDIYREKMDKLDEERSELIKRHDETRQNFFDGLETALLEKGLTTREMLKKCSGKEIDDGVVFLCFDEDDK